VTDVAKIVLGAVLAIITTLLVEIARFQITERRSKRLFRTLLRFELPDIAQVIDRLVEDIGRVHFFPFTRLNEIDGARQGFDRNRDWVVILRDNTARRDVYEFYRELQSALFEARGVENFAVSPTYQQDPVRHQPFVTEERTRLTDRFRDLAGRARNLFARIDDLR
jgi:hypothetical protein